MAAVKDSADVVDRVPVDQEVAADRADQVEDAAISSSLAVAVDRTRITRKRTTHSADRHSTVLPTSCIPEHPHSRRRIHGRRLA